MRAVETNRSLGESAGGALGREVARNRWTRAAYLAGRATLGTFARVAHVLWLEVTGFLFLGLAIIGASAAAYEYRKYTAGTSGRGRVYASAGFALLFFYFGVTSFWKARRKKV